MEQQWLGNAGCRVRFVVPRCHISLGGNSGPVAGTFEQALRRLQSASDCRVVAISRYYETAPVGDQAGAGYLNAVAEFETALAPLELLDKLQSIERDLGRTRPTRWGPRTLDLDLVFYGSQILDSPRLVVPHPAAWYRRFVLDPLVEIAPRFVHPVKEVEICTLRDRLLVRPLRVSLAGGTSEYKRELIGLLSPRFAAVEFSDWEFSDWDSSPPSGAGPASGADPASEPALILWLGHKSGLSAPATCDFEQLPRLSRIDATGGAQPVHDFARYVVQSALG